MTANLYQGEGGYQAVVGPVKKGRLPGMPPALKQGSQGDVMSDMQFMMHNEQKQHQQAYNYAHGHNDGSAPLAAGTRGNHT
jgi:hypothetical protein